MSLLPSSRPEVEAEQRGDFRLLGIDEEATDTVLEALSSETSRAILGQLHDEPLAPSELADLEDLSIQNVTYHLDKLETSELIEVAGTRYSEKGREMNVYAPADEPLVVFVGTDERKLGLRSLLKRFVGATGLLAVVSILLHSFIEGSLPYLSFTGAGGGSPDGPEPALPLATAIFLGGFVMLIVLFAWRYWEMEYNDILFRIRNTPLLGGRNPMLSRRVSLVTMGVSVVLAVPWLVITSSGYVIPALGPIGTAPAFTIALVGAAAIQAYYNDGLLVSWLVVFAPVAVFALGVFGVGPVPAELEQIAGTIGYPVIIGGVGALVLGTVGFVLGAGARRIHSRIIGHGFWR